MRMLVATFANIMGAIILIAIVLPWFLIAVFAVSIAYVWAAIFYRASARELKVSVALKHGLIAANSVVLTWNFSPPATRYGEFARGF